RLLKSVKLRDGVDEDELRARLEPLARAAGYDPSYFVAVDRVAVKAYVEDEALVVLSGDRVQSLLEASPVLHGLANQEFVSYRAMFPAAVREQAAAALEDLR
ncbi:MAG: hypothetical protein KC431_19910, partial [Myxococcales bacterium]|nr:hypothetical protein [Myxococcales bacterium]